MLPFTSLARKWENLRRHKRRAYHRRRARRVWRGEPLENRILLSLSTDLPEGLGPSLRDVSAELGYAPDELLLGLEAELGTAFQSQGPEAFWQEWDFNLGELLDQSLGHVAGAGSDTLLTRWSLPAGIDPLVAAAELSGHSGIAFAEPNYRVSIQGFPDDNRFDELWGMHNTGQTGGLDDADIDAPEAWDIATGSTGAVVGVIDTGVDYTHRDLYRNVWLNEAEIPSGVRSSLTDADGDERITFYDLNDAANADFVSDHNFTGYIDGGDLLADPQWEDGLDTDGNGFVDDLIGWDFINGDNDPFDDNSHGTHVSGSIAAVGDNNAGVAGVNWTAQIMGLKFIDSFGFGFTAGAIAAIDYATQMDAWLTNNSWGGGGFSSALRNAIAASGDAGQLFVAAAGNNGSDNDETAHYPSNYDLDNIVAVAATDHNDQLASFSNFGDTSVDLGAPGDGILSTVPGNGYDAFSGTSMATPHVAGAAALVWSLNRTATHLEVRDALFDGVDSLGSLGGLVATGGRLNLLGALQNADLSRGTIRLDGDVYSAPDTAQITVVDADLDLDPSAVDTATIELTSDTESDAEFVTLTETGASTATFTGSIGLEAGAVSSDGVLQVSHGDAIVATYRDSDNGTGSPATVTDTAAVDAQGPLIADVGASPGASKATIAWTTDEPADSVVHYGLDPGSLDLTASAGALTTSHSVGLSGLTPETTYYYEVSSTDEAGNTTTDDNDGALYSFTTTALPPILLVDDDEGDTLERFFTAALDDGGYAYDMWDVFATGASPAAGDLAEYSIVVWNTGANYTASTAGLTSGEQSSIATYLDGGGNLFLSGQDILYNGVSSQFRSDYLHVTAVAHDEAVHRAGGVAGDPISDGMDLPLSLPPEFESNYADTLQTDSEAEGLFLATETGIGPTYPYAAVRYPGTGAGDFKLVFFAFPFEGISGSDADPDNRATVMDRVIGWLGAPPTPGITVTPTSGLVTSEDGDTASFSVVLDTAPTEDVVIGLSTDTSEGLLSTDSLTFTPNNWDQPQTVTVTGVDDAETDGDVAYTIGTSPAASNDPAYDGVDPADVSATNLDNEASPLVFETGLVSDVGSFWTTVTLENAYDSMVVVASPNYDAGDLPAVVRIRNATGASFDVRVDNPSGFFVSGVDVHFFVVEEGVYTQAEHGVTMEAVKFTSTVTDARGSWVGQAREYANAYTQPVVLGQVMTYNDSLWSTFWSRGAGKNAPPDSDTLFVGKHVGEDFETFRFDETIGYVVIEAGAGSLNGLGYTAGLGADSVRGIGNNPPYEYSLTGLSSAATAIVSQAAMDGGNGGWAALYGANPVTASRLRLAIDEDQLSDGERKHTHEQVAFLVFEASTTGVSSLNQESQNLLVSPENVPATAPAGETSFEQILEATDDGVLDAAFASAAADPPPLAPGPLAAVAAGEDQLALAMTLATLEGEADAQQPAIDQLLAEQPLWLF